MTTIPLDRAVDITMDGDRATIERYFRVNGIHHHDRDHLFGHYNNVLRYTVWAEDLATTLDKLQAMPMSRLSRLVGTDPCLAGLWWQNCPECDTYTYHFPDDFV